MSESMEELLRGIARDATKTAQHSAENNWIGVSTLLKRRLLPLLEAGQDLRRGCQFKVPAEDWDAALHAAKEAK